MSWRLQVHLYIYTHIYLYIGTCKGGEKQWQTTPKNLPSMQRARAIPVTWLGSGSCQARPSRLNINEWMNIYISFIVTLVKLVNLVLSLFCRRYAHSWKFYIFTLSCVLDVVYRCVVGWYYYFYIFFVSWQPDVIYIYTYFVCVCIYIYVCVCVCICVCQTEYTHNFILLKGKVIPLQARFVPEGG